MYLLASSVFMLLDILWIYTNINIYNNLVYNIQGNNTSFNYCKLKSLFITYIFLLYGLNYIAIPYNIPTQLGLVVYGVYSFTNYTLFNKLSNMVSYN